MCNNNTEMNWFDILDNSDPIISPSTQIKGYLQKQIGMERFGVHERFLMLETGGDIVSLRRIFPISKEAFKLPAFLGKRTLYTIEEDPPISLVEKTLSAPVAVDVLEIAIAMGARKLFLFGLCGALAEGLEIGDVIIPTEIKREEGVSYHYAPRSNWARPNDSLVQQLLEFLCAQSNIRVHNGKTVTTDAVFRQTLNKELRWRDQGILGVEMEMSALLTVAQFHKIPAVSLLVVSDKHEFQKGSQWYWGGKMLANKRAAVLKTFVDYIKAV